MKKTIFTIIALIAISSVALAQQKEAFSKGDKLLNLGVGVNSYYSGGMPVGASFEVGVSDAISVGVNFDYLSHKYDFGYGISDKFTALYFGGRCSYHLDKVFDINSDKFDVYVGAALGYRSFTWNDTYSGSDLGNSYGSGIYLGGYVGGKYYFNNNIGAFVELGEIGSTNARLGVAFKF